MGIDPFNLLLSGIVFFIYSTICIISTIFTFSLQTYRKIDEIVKLEIIPSRILTPLEKNIYWIDTWLMSNNKIIGPILIVLSILDLRFSFEIINKL
ncbi:MAG: hypothetical protein NC828_01475 [Candidatus Omnitrophica bacterium]|nr:hypothetical protein [Candidatus Omnitrophota bacterium]